MALEIKKEIEGGGEYDPTPNPGDLAEAMELRMHQRRLRPKHMLALAKRIAEESANGEDKDEQGRQINGLGVEALGFLFASRQVSSKDQVEILRHHHQLRLQRHGHTMSPADRQQAEKRINELTQARDKIRVAEAQQRRRGLHLPHFGR